MKLSCHLILSTIYPQIPGSPSSVVTNVPTTGLEQIGEMNAEQDGTPAPPIGSSDQPDGGQPVESASPMGYSHQAVGGPPGGPTPPMAGSSNVVVVEPPGGAASSSMMNYSGGVMPAVGPIVSHEAMDLMHQHNPVANFAEDLRQRNAEIYTGANGDASQGTGTSSILQLDEYQQHQPSLMNDGFRDNHYGDVGGQLPMVPPLLPFPSLPYNPGQMGSMPISSAGLMAALNDGAFWKHLYQYKPTIIKNRDDIGDLSKLLPALEEKEASGGKLLLSLPSAVVSLRCPEIFWMFPSMPFFSS